MKRRFPARPWEDCRLSSVLGEDAPADPGGYRAFREQSPVRFFFPLGRPPRLPEDWGASAVAEADEILRGAFRYFSHHSVELGYPEPAWLLNPIHGFTDRADAHWSDTPTFLPSRGDIKFTWEPSRFSWAYALSRAHAVTGEDGYAEGFWTLFESWLAANPPHRGPNWKCGQEVALRTMACIFALHALWSAPASTDDRIASMVAFLAFSADRIAGDIGQALIQRSNHGASEAAGIYLVGLLFPELREAEAWRRRGRRILESEARDYNWTDGSYLMHSVNYQRMTGHVYLQCMRLADLNGEPFDDLVRRRLKVSGEFLYQLQDERTGRCPNYGPNDGALILPLNSCAFLDYRPFLQATHYLHEGERLYEDGPWAEDLLWLFGPDAVEAPVRPAGRVSGDFPVGGYHTLRGEETWGLTRCYSYRIRPNQADLLHLDVWWRGVNVLRDSGSYRYYDPQDEWNRTFVSTAAHNTVTVDGADQMVKGGAFRWHSLAGARFGFHEQRGDAEVWQGEHYGYRRLACRATHRRAICRIGEAYWLIVDDVFGVGRAKVRLYWYFPDLPCELEGDAVRLRTEVGDVVLRTAAAETVSRRFGRGMEDPERLGWDSLHYGERMPTPALCVETDAALPVRIVTLVGLGVDFDITRCDVNTGLVWEGQDGAPDGEVRLAPPSQQVDPIVNLSCPEGTRSI